MANLLCIYENKIATVSALECFFKGLYKYNSDFSLKMCQISRLTNTEIEWCDVLCLIRPNHPSFAKIAEAAKKHDICVIFFLDDDLLHLPKEHADMWWRKKGLKQAVYYSDIVVSSSPFICDFYREKANVERKIVIDTAVPKQNIKQHLPNKERIKLVYAAGLAHKKMFDQYIKPILMDLDDKYGDQISLSFMGVHPELNVQDYKMPIYFIDSLPLAEYRKRIEAENFDIGLAPLITNDFTKCKYFNKFIEYAMFGIVGIYSNTEPYTFVIENGENGLLCDNTPDDWFNVLSIAIEDKNLITKCRAGSYKTLEKRFDEETITKNFMKDISELAAPHRNKRVRGLRIPLIRFGYCLSRVGDWIYKSIFYFKKGGIKEMLSSIKRHFRVSKTIRS